MSRAVLLASLLAALSAAGGPPDGGHDKAPAGFDFVGCVRAHRGAFPMHQDLAHPVAPNKCQAACGHKAAFAAIGDGCCHCGDHDSDDKGPKWDLVDDKECNSPCNGDDGHCGGPFKDGKGLFSLFKKKDEDCDDDDDDDGKHRKPRPPHPPKPVKTVVETITSCPPEVTDCPERKKKPECHDGGCPDPSPPPPPPPPPPPMKRPDCTHMRPPRPMHTRFPGNSSECPPEGCHPPCPKDCPEKCPPEGCPPHCPPGGCPPPPPPPLHHCPPEGCPPACPDDGPDEPEEKCDGDDCPPKPPKPSPECHGDGCPPPKPDGKCDGHDCPPSPPNPPKPSPDCKGDGCPPKDGKDGKDGHPPPPPPPKPSVVITSDASAQQSNRIMAMLGLSAVVLAVGLS